LHNLKKCKKIGIIRYYKHKKNPFQSLVAVRRRGIPLSIYTCIIHCEADIGNKPCIANPGPLCNDVNFLILTVDCKKQTFQKMHTMQSK